MVAFQTLLKQTVTLVENRVKDKSSEDPLKDLAFLAEHYRSRHEWDNANAATRHMLALAEGDLNSDFQTTPIDVELHLSGDYFRRLNILHSNKALRRFIFTFIAITGIWAAALQLIQNPQYLLDVRAQIFATDPQTFVDRAIYYNNQSKLYEAITECNKALMIDPTNFDALHQKSFVLFCMGKYQESLTTNDLSSNHNRFYFRNRMRGYEALGDDKASATASEMANAIATDTNDLYRAAYSSARAGDPEKALRFAQLEESASKTDSEKAEALAQQARYFLRLSRYKEAIESATKSINVGSKPLVSRAFTYRAEAEYNLSSYKAAIDDASTATNMTFDDSRAYEVRAKSFSMLGQTLNAEADRHTADLWKNGGDL